MLTTELQVPANPFEAGTSKENYHRQFTSAIENATSAIYPGYDATFENQPIFISLMVHTC
jgi:hypothetical protein